MSRKMFKAGFRMMVPFSMSAPYVKGRQNEISFKVAGS